MSEQLLKEILIELKTLNKRVGNLEQGQQEMKTDVAELKTDVAELKTDVTELKIDVAELKTDVTELKTGQQQLETRIENELINKVRALFDAREIQNNINKQILDKLENVDININYLVAKVIHLEKIAK